MGDRKSNLRGTSESRRARPFKDFAEHRGKELSKCPAHKTLKDPRRTDG